jgi:CRP-like cAMP-binding protein
LSRLSEADRSALFERGRRLSSRAGRTLLAHGAPEPPVFILLSGAVKAFRSATAESSATLIEIYGAGDALGIESLLQDRPGHLTYLTARTTEFITIAQSAFEGYMERNPQVMHIVFTTVTSRLRDRDVALSYASKNVQERLIALLSQLEDTHGEPEDGAVIIKVGITQAEMASVIGASEAAVNREILKLKKNGFIESGYRSIKIKRNLRLYLEHGQLDRGYAK